MSSSRYTKKAKAKDNNKGNSNNDSVNEARKPSPRRTRSSTRIRKNIEGAGGSNPSFLNPTASSAARSRRQQQHQHQLTSAASFTSSASSSRTAAAPRKKPPTNNKSNNSKRDLKIMSSKNNSNAAASRNSNHANNPPNDNNEEDDVNPALQRLLDRLQREHSTNFGNNRPSGGVGGVNRTRAQYLLEASAGNVGLASALYWEDFIAEADEEGGGGDRGEGGGVMGGNDNNNNNESGLLGQGMAAAASSASAASSSGGDNAETASGSAAARHGFGPPAEHHHADRKGSSPKKRKAGGGSTADNDDNNEPSKKKSKKRGLRGTTDSMLARLKSSEDSTENYNPPDEEDGRKPSAAAGSGFDRALARARGEGLYLSETLRRAQERIDAVSGAAAAAAGGNAASAAGAGNDSELSAAAAEVLSRYPSLWYAASGPGGVNASGLAGALGAGSSPGRQLAGLFPNIYAAYGDPGAAQGSPAGNGRQNAFVDAMNAALRSAGAAASSNNPSAFLPGRGAAAAASSSGAAQGAGGGQSQLDYISRLLACSNNNALAAAGSGADRRLDESEARALMAALAGDLAATSGAASAAGAGGGGNGSDDSDNDSSNAGDDNNGPPRHGNNDGDEDNSRDDDEDAADNAAAPLRRSIRVRNRSRAGRNPPARNPPVAAARRRNNNNNNGDEEDFDDEERLVGAVRRRALAAGNRVGVARRAPDNNPSADISDTEDDDVTFLPGPVPVFRLKKGRDDGDRGRKSDQENKPKYSFEDSDNDGDHSDDESVDIDLLLHSSDAFAEPSIELWGSYPKHSPESDEDDDSDTNDNADRVIIPVSWLRTGMKLSECGNGLAMNGPSDEDWERNRRSRSALLRDGPLMGVKGLFPHNCKGVSVILSIVTALLYSGASIQGGTTVACDLKRVPFDELTVEQRKREFDPRLVDALSSLIFIAAQTGQKVCGKRLAAWESKWERHRKKGHPISPAEEDEYNTKRLLLQRRVGVCQVCWWEEDTTNGNTTVLYPENRDPYNVKFKTSFTSIQGLKSYVQTHLRSFKAPGGCALLLETILHCHGPYMPNKMSLLKCHCTESLDHLEKCAKTKNGLTLMPSDHDCVSTELLSLLLTGEFHSTLEDWSADMFGIGVLQYSSQETASLNNRLIRPIKPIWICKGDLGYSVLFVDYKGFIGSTNSLEEPGKVFKMAHWNCWSGERTGFRVITSMHDELDRRSQIQPTLIISDSDDECTRTVSDSISSRLLLEQKRDEAMPWKQSSNDASAATNSKAHVNQDLKPITDAELQAVSFHPEDEQYYPGSFIRWRFNFGDSDLADRIDEAQAEFTFEWIPFYRLRGRQRLIVEMKLAPRICGIVRSRWPLATVRDFTAGKLPLV